MLLGLIAPKKTALQQRYIRWVVDKYVPEAKMYRGSFAINNAFYNHWHRFLYDCETLKGALEEAGFVDVTQYSIGQSDDDIFQGIEQHGKDICDEEINSFETIAMEGMRPG
jgi:hypothetical protein